MKLHQSTHSCVCSICPKPSSALPCGAPGCRSPMRIPRCPCPSAAPPASSPTMWCSPAALSSSPCSPAASRLWPGDAGSMGPSLFCLGSPWPRTWRLWHCPQPPTPLLRQQPWPAASARRFSFCCGAKSTVASVLPAWRCTTRSPSSVESCSPLRFRASAMSTFTGRCSCCQRFRRPWPIAPTDSTSRQKIGPSPPTVGSFPGSSSLSSPSSSWWPATAPPIFAAPTPCWSAPIPPRPPWSAVLCCSRGCGGSLTDCPCPPCTGRRSSSFAAGSSSCRYSALAAIWPAVSARPWA